MEEINLVSRPALTALRPGRGSNTGFDAQSPCLEQRRPTEWALQVRKDLESLARQATGHDTVDELCSTARRSTDAQWTVVVRELFWDSSCVDPERHADTITTSSITCTECLGTGGETCR